jgi:hypothetical protein
MGRGVLGLVAALLLAGCAAPDPVEPSGASPTHAHEGKRSADPEEVLSDELGDLAEAAEEQASRAATSAPPLDPLAFPGPVLGGDVSWPQCPRGMGIPERRTLGAPMPLPVAQYVVVGLTNGPAFTPNPCLAEQVAWVRERELLVGAYAVTSFPDDATRAAYGGEGPFDGGTKLGELGNTGYQQAAYNIASMKRAGIDPPLVWIDVEPVADFEWSDDPVANAAVVQGVGRGYTDAGYAIGIYSTPLLWSRIVGDLELGLPEWRAAGQTSQAEAISRCGPDWVIQGGEAVLGQWVAQGRDMNITCPGVHRDLAPWFQQL